ncbi:MAG: ACP S-malonyltransferase [Cyanobacteria bacterium]|nr:ACP S-malonyltransferase [Cyanobacteriota bacterium]MDA1245928.1 ACP S-malonyltransferase [Cyanobacteriota bacterium]
MGIAWVFPGQGSQKVGMAEPVLELPGARERFDQASALLGRDLLAICLGTGGGGDLSDLNDTRNTQPALFVIESLLAAALQDQGRAPHLVAGHSLGELVALHIAGVFDFATGLQLMKSRSTLMAASGGGAMTAVMGFERSELNALVAATEGVVIANDNSDAQVVISGTPEAVAAVSSNLKCKRAIPLAVSGAFHSPFMAEAAAAFASELEAVAFADAAIPVLSNTDPSPETNAAALKARLVDQMTTGVRWRETMAQFEVLGIDTTVEIGPGAVLSGLIKRSCTGVHTAQISSTADLAL